MHFYLIKALSAGALAAAILTGIGCINLAGDTSYDEVARLTSPSGDMDAVLVETNGGATTSFGYNIFLVGSGAKYDTGLQVASLYGAVRNERAYGVNLKWENPQRLIVEYLRTKGEPRSTGSATFMGREIIVSLRAGVIDHKAPSGGMLYNLRR